jgi:hypothetical protein
MPATRHVFLEMGEAHAGFVPVDDGAAGTRGAHRRLAGVHDIGDADGQKNADDDSEYELHRALPALMCDLPGRPQNFTAAAKFPLKSCLAEECHFL